MTQSCCLHCRLRFAADAVGPYTACPFCGAPLTQTPARAALGLKRFAQHWQAEDAQAIDRALASMPPAERP